jgi:FkbM family methyltransferase|tara:strand:+ start:64 stop:753 length:690 start_codon:yes stop_codon:yes gene_type:complete
MIYKIVDKFLMNDFTDVISNIINKNKQQNLKIFDIGCFQGNFSRNLKNKLNLEAEFFLFDANPNLKIEDFEYTKLAFSNSSGFKTFYLNTFFPASGSSLNTIHLKDKLWNFTRKLITGNLRKQFTTLEVKVNTLDNYCQKNQINDIDVLKIDTEGSEMEILEGAKNILKSTNIILVEVLDEKKYFDKKYEDVVSFLEKNYNFKKVLEKKIWSVGTFSNMKAVDLMFRKY